VRVVWNDTLAYCQELYQQGEKKPKYTELSKRLTQIKKTKEKQWLTEVSSIPLQQSLRDLETAYSNFFASCKGEERKSNLLNLKNVNLNNQQDLPIMASPLINTTLLWQKSVI